MNQPSCDLAVISTPHRRARSADGASIARGAAIALACIAATFIAGCGNDSEYETAVHTNTVAAYDDYLRLHPDGSHAAEARARLAVLVEDREWQRAHAAGTSDAYQQYLRGYPSGAHAHDALMAIADLNLAAVPSTEATTPTPAAAPKGGVAPPAAKGEIARAPAPAAAATPRAAAPKPAAAAPKGVAAGESHAAPTAAAGVRIQLGAFGTKAGAEAAWRRLAGRYPELASRTPLIAAGKSADGHDIARLQVGGFSRESASAMCAALAAKHDACLVVPGAAP